MAAEVLSGVQPQPRPLASLVFAPRSRQGQSGASATTLLFLGPASGVTRGSVAITYSLPEGSGF